MRTRWTGEAARLDEFDAFLLGAALREWERAHQWPFPEYRDRVLAQTRAGLLLELNGMPESSPGAPACRQAVQHMRAGRDDEAVEIVRELLGREHEDA
jgi:hypothetical protein